jgi:hypothetical protein
MAKSVLEKIPLPIETQGSCRPSFPIPDALGRIRLRWKSKNHVDMVWHNGGRMTPPNAGLNPIADRFQKSVGGFGVGKWRQRAILGAAGDEKYGTVDIDPERKIVGERFAADLHEKMIRGFECGWEIFLPETALRA